MTPTAALPDTGGWQRLDPRMLLVYPVKELIRFLPVLIGLADGGVRFLSARAATSRLGPYPLAGSLAPYDQPAAGAIASLRGYLWSALLTPDGGEGFSLE